jgi:hypothetical protein
MFLVFFLLLNQGTMMNDIDYIDKPLYSVGDDLPPPPDDPPPPPKPPEFYV